jgi:protease-4
MATEQKEEAGFFAVIRRFVRGVFRAIVGYFAVIGLIVTLGPLVFFSIMARNESREMAPSSSKLKDGHPIPIALDLSGQIAQHAPGTVDRLIGRFFAGGQRLYLPDVRATLRRAGKDARVSKLAIRLDALSASPAEFVELRRILTDFRAGGKKVEIVLNAPEDWPYFLASAADQITVNPAASIALVGPAFHLIYLGDALKKLGVEVEVMRAGKYKSAFEPLVRNAPSDATLEEYRALQKSLVDFMAGEIAAGRKKDVATVKEWFKRSLYTADQAVAAGIVDKIGYDAPTPEAPSAVATPAPAGKDAKDAPKDVAKTPAKNELDEAIAYDDYEHVTRRDASPDASSGSEAIALLEAVGEINMMASESSRDDQITPDAMRKQIAWARDAKDVKAVVLRISSPGGSAVASDLIWRDLAELAATKPLVVSMGAYAASGGYYMSVAARHVVAEPTSITGSIGVIGMLPKATGFAEKYGVNFYVVTSSDRSGLIDLGGHSSPADVALVEESINQTYKTFISRVAAGRHLPPARVEELAQGRVYTGLEAKELGLVDELGGLQTAFTAAKGLAGLDKDKLYEVKRYEGEGHDLTECLRSATKMFECLQDTDVRMAPLDLAPPDAAATAKRVAHWLTASRREGALALWTGSLAAQLR